MTRPSFSALPPVFRVLTILLVTAVLTTVGLGGGSSGIGTGASATEAPADDGSGVTEETEETEDPAQAALDQQLRDGAEVYSQVCSSCHQPGGAGLPGQFPPLIDNPHVADADYVADVIANGLQGEIVVNGETYNGIMPSFSTLSDDDTAAVIAYMQNGFAAPAADIAEFEATGPVAGTELPALTNLTAYLAYLLLAAAIAMVLAPRLLSENNRLNTPWLDAWLKTAVIVLSVVLLTVFLPDWALKTSAVSKLSRFAQDFIGSSLWALGLAVVLGGLWYAHRESRV